VEEGSACRRGLYRTTHIYNRETIIPPAVSNPQSQQAMATELRLRLRGHRDRQRNLFHRKIFIISNDFLYAFR